MLYYIILRTSIAERLAYRVDFALGTLMRFLPIVSQIFLWDAIFQGMGSGGKEIARVQLPRADRLLPADDGRQGVFQHAGPGLQHRPRYSRRHDQEVSFAAGRHARLSLMNRLAHKLVYYGVAVAPFALVFWLCRGYFNGWPDAVTLLAFLASLVMSFLLGFFLEATLGMIGFWFLEVSSLLFVYMLVNFFFSGHMFPLDMMPGFGRW